MTNTKTTIITAALATLLGFAGIAVAAPISEFNGSRADVREFCATGEGYHLLEGGSFSLCTTPVTDVMCRDDNFCASSNIQLAFAAGFQREEIAALSTLAR